MATITLRSIKGSPLTITEMDDNFSNLNTDVGNRVSTSTYTGSDILTKLLTVDGTGSGLDADLLDGKIQHQLILLILLLLEMVLVIFLLRK